MLIQIPSILEKKMKNFTPYQTEMLVKRFQAKPYLTKGEKYQLARSLNVSHSKIEHWFVSRRYRKRKQGLLGEYKYSVSSVKYIQV